MSRVTIHLPHTSADRPGDVVTPASKSSAAREPSLQLQREELLKVFGNSLTLDVPCGADGGLRCSTEPSIAALRDEAIAYSMIQRASNPYHNHRSPARGLSLGATALNCILERSSRDIFEKLGPMHGEILTRCSTTPATFPSQDYAIAPYVLGEGRERGDLFLSELTRSDLSYRVAHIAGSAPRFLGAGADAPYGFLLMHKDVAIAAVSYVVTDGPSLFVVMTQRLRQQWGSDADIAQAKVHEKATKRLRLKEALLAVSSSIAETLGCASITYQGAINNRWVHEMVSKGGDDGWNSVCVPRMRFEDAQATYDTFCEAHGFTRDPQSRNFVKAIATR